MPKYIDELSLLLDNLSAEMSACMSQANELRAKKATLMYEMLGLKDTEPAPKGLLESRHRELAKAIEDDENNQKRLAEITSEFIRVKTELVVEARKITNTASILEETVHKLTESLIETPTNPPLQASNPSNDPALHPLVSRHEELNHMSSMQLQQFENIIEHFTHRDVAKKGTKLHFFPHEATKEKATAPLTGILSLETLELK